MSTEDLTAGVAVAAPSEPAVLTRLAVVDDVAELVDTLLGDLRSVIPELTLRRGFLAGCWVFGLHAGPLPGERGRFSRLDLRLRVVDDGAALEVEACHTVRDRDVALVEERLAAGSPELTDWLQAQAMAFTDRYFDRR